MALHASDLLTPKGRLNAAALWPAEELDAVTEKLEEYLAEGYTKAEVLALSVGDRDEPARLWANYRAYQEVYERLLLLPSTVSTSDEGSSSYLLTQMEHVGELAEAELTAYRDEVGALTTDEAATYGVIRSLR